jgi:hypothetical protein
MGSGEPKMIVIGIGNRARNGKDTAAEAIMNHASRLGLPSWKLSWADALYQEVNRYLEHSAFLTAGPNISHGIIENGVDEIKIPLWVKPTPDAEISTRAPFGKHAKLLQWWGTEFRRAENPNYWVEKVTDTIKEFERINPRIVVLVPDTRFFNEAQAIKSMGGYTLNVSRLTDGGQFYLDPSRDAYHLSETELEGYNWDFKISSKSKELTEKLAIAVFEHILESREGK